MRKMGVSFALLGASFLLLAGTAPSFAKAVSKATVKPAVKAMARPAKSMAQTRTKAMAEAQGHGYDQGPEACREADDEEGLDALATHKAGAMASKPVSVRTTTARAAGNRKNHEGHKSREGRAEEGSPGLTEAERASRLREWR